MTLEHINHRRSSLFVVFKYFAIILLSFLPIFTRMLLQITALIVVALIQPNASRVVGTRLVRPTCFKCPLSSPRCFYLAKTQNRFRFQLLSLLRFLVPQFQLLSVEPELITFFATNVSTAFSNDPTEFFFWL